jgi:hypothetical protein
MQRSIIGCPTTVVSARLVGHVVLGGPIFGANHRRYTRNHDLCFSFAPSRSGSSSYGGWGILITLSPAMRARVDWPVS